MTPDIGSTVFWDAEALREETLRTHQICSDCRLCFKFCPSFPALFKAVDGHDGKVTLLTPSELERVVDLCFQCKLCYVNCPYTPPHAYELDFPRLMLRSVLVRKKAEGLTSQDRFLGNPDLAGKLGGLGAPVSNWANRFGPFRLVLEKLLGVHRDRWLPQFHRVSFERWFRRHSKERAAPKPVMNGKVVLFSTCSVNYNHPEIGRSAVQVLEHNDVEIVTLKERCCGMPNLESGNVSAVVASLRQNVAEMLPYVRNGYTVVVSQPTCGYMLRQEYPWLEPTPETREVAAATMDLCEYLMSLHAQKRLKLDFLELKESVAYHLPCHLKAQNVGYKSRDLLSLIPGLKSRLVDRCSGMDGTWGMKKETFDESRKVAARLFPELEDPPPDRVASDCTLAGLQIRQGTGRKVMHPIEIVREAYGLPLLS